MQVRLLTEWRGGKPGAIIERGDGVADILFRRGVAEKVTPALAVKQKHKRRRR